LRYRDVDGVPDSRHTFGENAVQGAGQLVLAADLAHWPGFQLEIRVGIERDYRDAVLLFHVVVNDISQHFLGVAEPRAGHRSRDIEQHEDVFGVFEGFLGPLLSGLSVVTVVDGRLGVA